MKKIKKIIILLRDFPKILYVNLKIFDIKTALKMPIKIKYNAKIGNLSKGCIKIDSPIERFMIKLGYLGSNFISENKSFLSIKNNGILIFKGRCTIGEGFNIFINNGNLIIGNDFYSNRNLMIQCEKKIQIGENALFGWNLSIRDTDGHNIRHNSLILEHSKNILIGDRVWIASNCTILKGASISNESIIGCNSLVTSCVTKEENCLIVGSPAKVKKKNIKLIN